MMVYNGLSGVSAVMARFACSCGTFYLGSVAILGCQVDISCVFYFGLFLLLMVCLSSSFVIIAIVRITVIIIVIIVITDHL